MCNLAMDRDFDANEWANLAASFIACFTDPLLPVELGLELGSEWNSLPSPFPNPPPRVALRRSAPAVNLWPSPRLLKPSGRKLAL